MPTTVDKRTISVRLSEDVISKLRQLAERQGISATAALQKAIETEVFVRDEIDRGAKILVKENDHLKEVVFR
jgi:predicted transcriptional regulator